jgi:hypothetical protein
MTVPVNGKTRPEPSLDVRTLAYIIGCLSSLRTSQAVVIDAWPELFPILTSASRGFRHGNRHRISRGKTRVQELHLVRQSLTALGKIGYHATAIWMHALLMSI